MLVKSGDQKQNYHLKKEKEKGGCGRQNRGNMRKQGNPKEKYLVYAFLSRKCEGPELTNQKLASFFGYNHLTSARAPFVLEEFIILV